MVESADPNTVGVQVDPSSNPTAGRQAKRVILRLQVDDFSGKDPYEYNDAIKAYLTFAGRESAEWEKHIHFAHIEPFQDPELRQTLLTGHKLTPHIAKSRRLNIVSRGKFS